MCDNSTFPENAINKCHPIEEIAEYLKLITVESWSSYGRIDFGLHDKAPIVRKDLLLRTDSLEYGKIADTKFKYQKNSVETEDHWYSIGQTTLEFDYYELESQS